ncbi:unnamed protein product [Camellia sinensis]
MGVGMGVVMMMLGMVISLATVAHAAQGTATYYGPPYKRMKYLTSFTRRTVRIIEIRPMMGPYEPNNILESSACYGNQDKGVMIAAASDAIGGKAACGRKYNVTCTGPTNQGVPRPCTGKSVVVTIVDYCPPGCQGTIDLSQAAFAMIADRNAGKVKIEYTR